MTRMIYFKAVWIYLVMLIVFSCVKERWEEHYNNNEEKVNRELWDVVKEEPRYTKFVEYVEEHQLDTLFDLELSFTLFIPDNDAFVSITDTAGPIDKTIANHISRTVFLTRNVDVTRKLQTLNGKFAVVERTASGFTFEGHHIEYSSPLYLDGVYYEIKEIAYPKPNLYEYTALFSSVIKKYIDDNDSLYLDKSLSTPVGFDEYGNTIYDSIFGVVNTFERDFFPVSMEFRDKSATFLLFTQGQYDAALDEMALQLGPGFDNPDDIPIQWQFKVLMPDIVKRSLFDNSLSYTELKNIMVSVTGDTVEINLSNINEYSKYHCSNGIVYNYTDFSVPRELYQGEIRIEGEELVDSIGSGRFAWKDFVTVTGYTVEPERKLSSFASEELVVNVQLPRNYTGDYTVSFPFENILPMKYRLVWRANHRPSGTYAIYVNDLKIGEYDNYNLRSSVLSVTGERFLPEGGYNRKDWWVENITEFGSVIIRFEYLNSGISSTDGFNIDYIALIPELGE